MAYTNIDNPVEYFNTVLYTGNGSSPRSLTGVGFSPDFVWIKSRSDGYSHSLYNSVTGGSNYLMAESTAAEQPNWGVINSFDADGFTVATGSSGILHVNGSGTTYASWNWRGSDSSAVSNTAGTITSTVSANTTSGFSIVSYTGTGANATIGHGLGVAPSMIITKSRGTTNNWGTYHSSLGNTKAVFLNLTDAADTSSVYWNNTSPTSSVFSVGSAAGTNPANTMIAYCFAEVKGYSKFGSYTGNGSTDGTFVYTGFKPSFIMYKNSSDGTTAWSILDNKRSTFNVISARLFAESSSAEDSSVSPLDFTSNGFKARSTNAGVNGSGNTIIYMAFAESPFVSSTGIPTTAR